MIEGSQQRPGNAYWRFVAEPTVPDFLVFGKTPKDKGRVCEVGVRAEEVA